MTLRELLFGPKTNKSVRNGTPDTDSIVIEIPAELYYKELAVYTASNLIGNAISMSEIKCFEGGVQKKNADYFLLNVSPNRNETAAVFWHKVINSVIHDGKALVVCAGGYMYCAEGYSVDQERPILGDVYSNVAIGNLVLNKTFNQKNSYLFTLDDVNVRKLIDGMYTQYGSIMKTAAKAFKDGNATKYKLHIDGYRAGDEEFQEEYEKIIVKQLEKYLKADGAAVFPEFDGYTLSQDETRERQDSKNLIDLRNDLFRVVASAFHIPDNMITGEGTKIDEVIGSFLTFGVDPYADMITQTLNKQAGIENWTNGNRYKCDTSKVRHRDIFDLATSVSYLISSGIVNVDEIREEIDREPLNTEWSKKYWMTKNYAAVEDFMNEEGGERDEG